MCLQYTRSKLWAIGASLERKQQSLPLKTLRILRSENISATFEEQLCKIMKRMEFWGKYGLRVALLLTPNMLDNICAMIEVRNVVIPDTETTNIHASHARNRSKTIKPACSATSATSAMRGHTCDVYQMLYASRKTIRTHYHEQTKTGKYCYQCQLPTFSDSFFSTTSPESEITDDECEHTGIFDDIRHDHPSGFIAAYLNINSARNKITNTREASLIY